MLMSGVALIFGLLSSVLGGGSAPEPETVVVAPPPMPALEHWNPGVQPPTLEEVIFNLIQGAESVTPPPTAPRPTPTTSPAPRPPVIVTPPLIIPPTVIDAPAPPAPEPNETNSTTALLKGALVNIICTPAKGYNVRSTSGTGVIIDSRGIIITVAHVGQNFLLEDYPTKDAGSCVIRTGSPARNAYKAELIYLSKSWIEENPEVIVSAAPKGTGEHDFALLAVTGSAGVSVPASFTAVRPAPAGKTVKAGDDVSVGSYGAEFLTSSQVRSSLYPTITFGSIKDAYAFSRANPVDIFSVNAGAAAQQGSSGGGVLNDDNQFLGLITTRTVRADLSLRDLQALTIDHIRRSFKADTGNDFDSYIRGNLSTLVSGFEDDAAELLDVIDDGIQ